MKNNKTNLNALNQKIYTYWQALYLSFYSARLYIDVGKRWRGWGLIYFFLVIAIAAIPLSIKAMHKFNEYYKYRLVEPIEKIPSFEIQRGTLVFPYFMPYLIKNSSGETAIIIDDKANLTELNYIYPNWMMIFLQDRMYIRLPKLSFIPETIMPTVANLHAKNIDMQPFNDINYSRFNGKTWVDESNLVSTKRYMMIAIYPSIVMMLFGFLGVLLFFLAILGKAFSHILFKFRMSFKLTYRLMLVSSSCGVTVFLLSLSIGGIDWIGFSMLILIALYFFYAVLSLKRESKNMVLA